MELFKDTKVGTYLHTTHEERALSIFKYGFLVNNCLSKTTDEVVEKSFGYWFRYRRVYGSHTLVIQISHKLLSTDGHRYLSTKKEFDKVYDILSKLDDEELVFEYLLPPRFIKGYYIRKTMEFINNPHFNPF